MKKRTTRCLALLLAVVMILSVMPVAMAEGTSQTATLVTDASSLKAGDKIILAAEANSKTYAAGALSGKFLASVETTFTALADDVEIFTLGGEKDAWTLTGKDGKKISTDAAKKLNNADKGTSTWTIAIAADGKATIASTNTSYGRMLYNVNDPRFMNYTSNTNKSMLLPSIYKVAPARTNGIIALGDIKNGDTVVIFNPANGKALSTEYSSFYNKGTDVSLADGKLTGWTKTDLWTVGVNEDGTYTFSTSEGKKLSMQDTYGSMPLESDKATHSDWSVTAVTGKTNTYYIDNVYRAAVKDETNYRMQWNTRTGTLNWSTYNGTGELFEQQFYLVVDSGSDEKPDPTPEPTTVPISTALAGKKDASFTVKGVVTLVDGQNYYLQDATGGICLRLASSTTEIALGDTIIGTGKRDTYNGLPQLGSGTFQKSSGLTLQAKPTTIDKLTKTDICTYVSISDLEVTEVYDDNGKYSQPNITVKDANGKTIQLYKAAVEKVNGAWAYKVGDKLDVTAAVGNNYNKTTQKNILQLRTTKTTEIKLHSDVYDPISDDMIPEGALNVKQAGEITTKTENVTVVGQVVYHYGKNYNGSASIDSIILEDVIDGNIYGFQVYDYTNYAKYVVGDVVKITGTVEPYNGVPQMKFPAMEVVRSSLTPIAAQEITVSQMGADYLSEYVYIKDITLGTYNGSGNTKVTDATGSMNLYQGVPLPTNVKEADVIALYACCSAHKGTYQLRNGSSADYVTNKVPTPSEGLPNAGDEFVIYNQNAKGVLAAQSDSKTIEMAPATIENEKAIPGNGAVVFTVERSGDYYRFKSDAYGYLCSNGTGSNAFYSATASEDADWLVRECSGNVGGFEMESRVAKYKGYSQWLEYYAGEFKAYSMDKSKVEDYTIYSFFFYPVAESVKVTDGIVNVPSVDFGTIFDAYVGQAYTLDFKVHAVFGVGTLTVKLGEETLTATKTENGYSVTIPVQKVTGNQLTVTVSGQDMKGEKFEGIAMITVKDEPVITNLTPRQGAQTEADKRPAISADIVNAGTGASVTMTVNGTQVNATYDGKKVTYTPSADFADGTVTVNVTVKREDGKTAAKTWSFTIGKAEFQLYFGQLHSHTNYSDGAGTLEDALKYVKALPGNANVHFVAFTDHSNYFDKSGAANPEGALYDMSKSTEYSQQRWKEYKDAVAAFNTENAGSMVALAGFEMTWSGGPGHINTFNTPGIVSRNNTTLNNKTADAGLQAYYKLLSQAEGVDSISQFNHPGTTFGNFVDFAYWDAVIDSRMYMVEVGNGEGQIGAGGYYPSYEQYIMALDKGWHVAPTNNQDNHKGKWGNANDARDVILTDDFTEQGIYRAIRARRMYATEDKNLQITYTVNDLQLGSSITEVPEKLNFSVTFYDPDKTDSIVKVELVANSGIVAHTWSDPAELASGKVEAKLDPKYSYYFVRVTEGDGDLAVTAPVWVGETLKLGISQAKCGTSTPVTDEELTITTTLFNSEAEDATILGMAYTVDDGETGIVVDTNTRTLAASSTLDVDFKYTPKKARLTTVTIVATVKQGDNTYTFTKDVTLDVLDASKLVYIGIDASHYNEYVAGNYKDSMGNFGELAAAYSVRTVTLKTSEELIAACSNSKYKAIILTAPSRRLEAAQADPKTYSADELNAIKAFNDKGGMVILAGWGDKYEAYSVIQKNSSIKHMAETQNDVLETLGSSLRISDDSTYDTVMAAPTDAKNGPWRLYFSSYNLNHELLKGVDFDPDHPHDVMYTERFSQYGGASIYAVDTEGNPTSTLPATVSPVVYAHATTASQDYDKDTRGGAGTPKYAFAENDNRLMVMATEQLTGRGMIVVAGAAFMSNFEVQYQVSDNGAEKNYSNYKICENLMQLLNPVKITPIKTVQAEPDEGVKFTVEGIVTSNASGYDKDTAFFDCIYVQDDTAGINAFPVAGNFKIGDKVRITGTTSSYQGERQLAVKTIVKLADAKAPAPKDVTAAQINNGSVLGSLVRIKGTITKVEKAEGKIQTIMVKDAAGNEARVFIDGYITTAKEVQDAIVGYQVEAIGLASYDNTFVLSDNTSVYPRIRIRDRSDITCTKGSDSSNPDTPVIPVIPSKPGNTGTTGTTLRFDDVSRSDWFYDDVRYVYENGIMDGTGAYRFAPNAQLTRAMIVTILYRMDGSPSVSGSSDFTDVAAGKWFAKAVAWAAANGIVNGYGSGRFGPNDPVTREQLAAILYRYTAYRKAAAASNGDNLASFSDLGTVSGYALESMNWAVGAGLLKGANGKLDPKANATRAQVAAIIRRYLER